MGGKDGSIVAPAARCRNLRRGSFMLPSRQMPVAGNWYHIVGCNAIGELFEHLIRSLAQDHSGLMPANLTTLPHFSVSSAMSLPKSAGEPESGSPPMSAN